ncbi:MAG: ubiquinone/menaquinone biosynthesis methyltransferase [candidate division WOR-3 bacterium]
MNDDGSPRMFSRIVRNYDRMNKLMSLGLDAGWRAKASAECSGLVLDLCCGTGEMAIASAGRGLSVIGLDGDIAMLVAARAKSGAIPLVRADATSLPFASASFDSVSIAWGIRNIPARGTALFEAMRVLRPGGKLVALESVLPDNPAVCLAFRLYARFIIPLLARLIGSDTSAYRYFARSVENFGPKRRFLKEMADAGFERPRAIALSFGLVILFTGKKAERF